MAKEVHELFVNSLWSEYEHIQGHASSFSILLWVFQATLESGPKVEKCCFWRGLPGDEFLMPDVRNSCIIKSLED